MTSFPGDSSLGSAFRRSPTLNRDSDRSVGRNLAGHVLGPGTNNFGDIIDSAARSSIGVVTIKPGSASSAPQSTTGDVEEPLLRASEDDAASALQRRLEFACEPCAVRHRSSFVPFIHAYEVLTDREQFRT